MGKFEDSMSRLEQIVNLMESGEQSLEDSLKLFKEGMRLSEYCSGVLTEAQRKVEMLVKQKDGAYKKTALDDEEGEEEGASIAEEPE